MSSVEEEEQGMDRRAQPRDERLSTTRGPTRAASGHAQLHGKSMASPQKSLAPLFGRTESARMRRFIVSNVPVTIRV